MGKRYLERHIVTEGDLGFVAAAGDLYTQFVKNNRITTIYNVAPKQLIMWVPTLDGSIPQTIAPADVDITNVNELRIGVGYDVDGIGISTDIRLIGPDRLEGCLLNQVAAYGPQCSVAEIQAIYPGCISCEEFTVQVTVDDNKTRSFSDIFASKEKFTSTYIPDCATCDDCPVDITCDELMCGIVDQLNNDLDLRINGKLYPDWNGVGVERDYRAVKLHANWYSYCISPDTGETGCKDCYRFDDLTTFDVDSVSKNFVGVVDPKDATKTLVAQLEYAAMQIEAEIQADLGKHAGFAFVSKGMGDCCPVQLHVVTCDDTFTIAGLTPCAPGITQFPDFTENGVCQECGSSPTVTTPTCGLAVIAKQDQEDCDCYLNLESAYYGRHITVDVLGNSKTARYTKRATLQEGVLPANFGAEVQNKEYAQIAGGMGRTYSNTNTFQGKLGRPESQSKLRHAITADCKTSYCSYFFGAGATGATLVGQSPITRQIDNYIWVPENDTTTQTAVELLMTNIIAAMPTSCKVLTAVTC